MLYFTTDSHLWESTYYVIWPYFIFLKYSFHAMMHKLTILPLFHPFFSSLILFLWIWFFVLFFLYALQFGPHCWCSACMTTWSNRCLWSYKQLWWVKNDCIYKRQADSMMATVMWEDVLQYHLIFVLIVLLSTFRKIQA